MLNLDESAITLNSEENNQLPNESLDADRNESRRFSGRLYGVRNYNRNMIETLLNLVDQHLPADFDDWQIIVDKYNNIFHENKNKRSIKRKFMKLVSGEGSEKTNSNPNSEEVRRAKMIHEKIRSKVHGIKLDSSKEGGAFFDVNVLLNDEDDDDDSVKGNNNQDINVSIPSQQINESHHDISSQNYRQQKTVPTTYTINDQFQHQVLQNQHIIMMKLEELVQRQNDLSVKIDRLYSMEHHANSQGALDILEDALDHPAKRIRTDKDN